MMTVLILHGITGNAENNWQPWLRENLMERNVDVIVPNLPNTDHPDRKEWLGFVKDLTANVDLSGLVIVAHSLGVTTALDFIESLNEPIYGLISVSGFSDDYKHPLNSYFLAEKPINFTKVKKNCKNFKVVYGDDDPYVPQTSLQMLADDVHVEAVVIHSGGHLNANAGYLSFPLLMDVLLEWGINASN